MPVLSGDIRFHYSDLFAGSGFDDARTGSGASSFGRWFSKTAYPNNTLHNVWDVIVGDESNSGDTEYRGIAVYNSHATLTLIDPKLWISAENPSGAHIEMAIDGFSASPIAQRTVPQMFSGVGMSNEGQVPMSGATAQTLTWNSGTTKGAGLSLGDIPAGYAKGIWLKRYVGAGTGALDADYVTLKVEGDSAQ